MLLAEAGMLDKLSANGEQNTDLDTTTRTGTFSIYQSFQMLGYKPYHMYECVMNGETHMSLLNEALRNKYLGEGKPYDKADFDKWLAAYDVR